MTKKDFELIAGMLRVNYRKDFTNEELDLYKSICRYFAYQLSRNYPKFDKDRFLNACKVKCDGKHTDCKEIINCNDCINALEKM